MTVIAAATNGRVVCMAADSASTQPDGRIWTVDKVNRLPVGRSGHALFGAAGDHRLSHLARSVSAPFEPDPASDVDCDSWAQAIAEALTAVACEAQPPVTDDEGDMNGYAVLGYAGRIWVLLTNVADRIRDDYTAIGSGGDLALGVLAATDGVAGLETRVSNAVATACRYNNGCAPPISTVTASWPGDTAET